MGAGCVKDIFQVAVGSRDVGAVNWMEIGQHLIQSAMPYIVQYIGDVPRPSRVDVDDAFNQAENLSGFKPYNAPAYKKGTVRALMIGINYYGSSCELSGCVNDVRQELATFQKSSIPIDELVILVDEPDFPNVTGLPTRSNIVNYMAWLVHNAQPGDVLFMHYSGHGSQTRSNDQYEEKDQVICPVDYESAGCIVDNDIYQILAANLPRGVRMTVVFDCCHSGSMLDLPYTFVASSDVPMDENGDCHMKQIRNNNFTQGDVVMISGCADSQTSADVRTTGALAGGSTSGAGGAATQCLTNILLNGKGLSYQETLLKTRESLRSKGFEQVPQLSASKPIDLNQKFSLLSTFSVDSMMRGTLPRGFTPSEENDDEESYSGSNGEGNNSGSQTYSYTKSTSDNRVSA